MAAWSMAFLLQGSARSMVGCKLSSTFLPRLPFRFSSSKPGHLLPNTNARVSRRGYAIMKMTSSMKARERMRQMIQQRDSTPSPPGPNGIPTNMHVGISNIVSNGLPTHPNSPKPAYVLVASATGNPHSLGDCPFSQRILMTLEEKNLPYEGRFIDVENKPSWFLDLSAEGNIPLMYIDEKWIADTDIILELVEQKVSIPTFRTPSEKASIGLKIFPMFVKFLKSKDPSDGSEQALIQELQDLNEHLKIEDAAYKNPFVNGRFLSMIDTNLAPKLYHMGVALKHFKQWELPSELKYVDAYMTKLFTRPSFTKTKPSEDLVIRGWERNLARTALSQ
ncbi:hypothetical protein O6H91_18G050700 [Diphasiastrum complanatum]|uniref:Uncharacterized protein n=1 Tax=Diphasiastrum complanatum TaxID=34168 RepID=A0ACC2B0Y9_DIPCM|nr:hypothetical protein O6H91_18G050700 [Diphasiastrum complanatum]